MGTERTFTPFSTHDMIKVFQTIRALARNGIAKKPKEQHRERYIKLMKLCEKGIAESKKLNCIIQDINKLARSGIGNNLEMTKLLITSITCSNEVLSITTRMIGELAIALYYTKSRHKNRYGEMLLLAHTLTHHTGNLINRFTVLAEHP